MSDTASKSPKTRKPNVGSDPTKGSRVRQWQIGFYAFAIGASVILLGFTARSLLRGNFPRILVIFSLLVTGLSWTFVRSKNKTFNDPGGVKISNAETKLREFVQGIADQVGAPMPAEIVLVADAALDMREATRYFGRVVDRSTLVIGLPYLQVLSKQELAALIAHELAHYADTDIEEGAEAIRSLREARELIGIERQGFVNGVYGSYARKMFRSVGGVGVAQENAADQLAVEAYGTDAMVSALAQFDEISVAFDQLLREYVVPALQNQVHPADMFEGFAAMLASPVRAEERARDLEKRVNKERNEFDLHRSPTERIETISSWSHTAGAVQFDDAEASGMTLLDPAEKSEEIVVGTWASTLMTNRTEAQTWQQLTDEIYSAKTYTVASIPFDEETEPAEQLAQAMTWAKAGDWQPVDEALGNHLKKGENLEACRTKWARCVVVEAAVATDSCNWHHNWDGAPLAVLDSGETFDAQGIADLMLDGDVEAARAAFDKAL